MKNLFIKSVLFFILLANIGCTEQYALQSSNFEDALVVEATITNEMKQQQIKLSRTYRFEENGPTFEAGAVVFVTDDLGNQYNFTDNGSVYLSVDAFEATAGRSYKLHIMTNDGKTYLSNPEILTTVNQIEDVVPTVQTVSGIRGVQLNVKSHDPAATSKYYRYDYAETYKIIAPRWTFFTAITVPSDPPGGHDEISVFPRPPGETKTCFNTEYSNDIIQTTTTGQSEDIVDFPVRFISDQNAIITHRYSILVRQYVQSLPAYTFYKTLKEISGSGSILSQNQPGFFFGNVRNADNPAEKVVGFFEVASVSSKRIFFNYADLFPGEPLPPYFVDCSLNTYKFCFVATDQECRGGALLSALGSQSQLYFDDSYPYYILVLPPCGDCTKIGSNVIPSFWED